MASTPPSIAAAISSAAAITPGAESTVSAPAAAGAAKPRVSPAVTATSQRRLSSRRDGVVFSAPTSITTYGSSTSIRCRGCAFWYTASAFSCSSDPGATTCPIPVNQTPLIRIDAGCGDRKFRHHVFVAAFATRTTTLSPTRTYDTGRAICRPDARPRYRNSPIVCCNPTGSRNAVNSADAPSPGLSYLVVVTNTSPAHRLLNSLPRFFAPHARSHRSESHHPAAVP